MSYKEDILQYRNKLYQQEQEYQQKLKRCPAGSLEIKTKGEYTYYYKKERLGNKVKSTYLGKDKQILGSLIKQYENKRRYKYELKLIKEEIKKLPKTKTNIHFCSGRHIRVKIDYKNNEYWVYFIIEGQQYEVHKQFYFDNLDRDFALYYILSEGEKFRRNKINKLKWKNL